MDIRGVRFTAAGPAEVDSGMLGWLAFEVGPLRLDGVALRKTLAGELALSWPVRDDRAGRRHAIVRPIDEASRAAITSAVLQALGLAEEAAR